MNRPELNLTADEGLDALRAHVVEKALEARASHGPDLTGDRMHALVEDRAVVRFRASVVFDAAPLRPGEFGWAMPLGDRPHEGFALVLHPSLESRPDDWPLCAAYHLVTINYLDVATSAEAEAFGAALFGMSVEAYYERLCAIADSLPNALGFAAHQLPGEAPPEPEAPAAGWLAPNPAGAFLAPVLGPASSPSACGGECTCG